MSTGTAFRLEEVWSMSGCNTGGYGYGMNFFAFAIVIYVLLVIILRAGFWGGAY